MFEVVRSGLAVVVDTLEDADAEVYSLRRDGKPRFEPGQVVGIVGQGFTLHGRIRKVTPKDLVIRPVRRA